MLGRFECSAVNRIQMAVVAVLVSMFVAVAASAQVVGRDAPRGYDEYKGPYAQFGIAVGRVDYDDLAGEPSGHFVVLAGYDKETRRVQVADPLKENPMGEGQTYWVDIDRLICAIMLGILTYDANLLILQPPTE